MWDCKNWTVQSLTAAAMTYDSTKGLWAAEGIPTAPYDDAQVSKPYPMVQLVARIPRGKRWQLQLWCWR
jgi:hypothetical protein